jgi:serine/threonine protein kinase
MSDDSSDIESAGADSDFVTLRPGHVVGRYHIVSVLGQGGFGITYRARDAELGREIAIKEYLPAALAIRQDGTTVLPRSNSAAEDFAWGRDRFIAEGRTLAALHRVPGIVLVHDFFEANGTAYLVMELLGGQTLQEQVERQGSLDAARIDKILWPLLDGLEQVHSAGFLHRDIKPANILLDGEGRPTLIDFGASRAAVAGRSQAMTAVFTPGYAAVEQFTAAAQGPWTDIYGLAATLHHAITGQAPPNAIDRILDDTYSPLVGSNRPFPQELLAGIDTGLAVRAAHRPQSIAAWRTALSPSTSAASAALATVVMRGAPSVATTVAAPPGTASRKRPALMLAAAVAVICALAGGWFVLSPRPSAPPSSAQASIATVPAPAKDHAQEELEQARREQKAALEEAARLRTEAETRRKSDEEVALRRKIEEEMRQKVEADEATRRHAAEEAKRQAEAQAAAQRQAEEEAKSKAEAEAAVRLKAEEADLKGAEAAEAALRLTQPDRQRIQVALTALGFVTGSSDGVFGPRSREMIASWQKKSGRAATGYVSADTQTALLREAAPALARYDEEQKKLAETHQAPAASQEQASSAKGSGQCEGIYSGEWCRGAFQGFPPSCWHVPMTVRKGAISGSWTSPGASEPQTFTGRINAGGEVQLTYNGIGQQTYTNQHFTVQMTGRMAEGIITAGGRAGSNGRDFTVRLQCR